MDDQNFDAQTAADWIAAVEKPGKTLRDEDIYPRLDAWFKANSPKTVVDLGCGQGICSAKLKNLQAYVGVDPSPALIERAKTLYNAPQNTFIEGNAYKLPLDNASADGVFSVLVFHLLQDLQTAVAELARVLKPGGSFNIITANPAALKSWASFYDDAQIDDKCLSGTMDLMGKPSADVLYFHTLADFEAEFKKHGLTLEAATPFRKAPEGKDLMLIELAGRK